MLKRPQYNINDVTDFVTDNEVCMSICLNPDFEVNSMYLMLKVKCFYFSTSSV